MVTYIPMNCAPAELTDLTLTVIGDAAAVVVVVVAVELELVVELVVVVDVVVVREGDIVKARFVVPCRENVVVPPPPLVGVVLANVPAPAPVT
jgi:hypothetical protein